MTSIVNVNFKVTRADQTGNPCDPCFFLLHLESVNLDQSVGSLVYSSYDCHRFKQLFVDIGNTFPELKESQRKYLIISRDSDGDKILIENVNDIHAIIQINKMKCIAGEAIPLFVISDFSDVSPNSPTVTDEQDITKHLADFAQMKQDVSNIQAFLKKLDLKINQQHAETKRLLKTLQTDQDDNDSALMTNSDRNVEDITATLTASLGRLEIKIKEQNDKINELPAKMLASFNKRNK